MTSISLGKTSPETLEGAKMAAFIVVDTQNTIVDFDDSAKTIFGRHLTKDQPYHLFLSEIGLPNDWEGNVGIVWNNELWNISSKSLSSGLILHISPDYQEVLDTYDLVSHAISDLIYITELDGTIHHINQPVAETYGYEVEEMIGTNVLTYADYEETDVEGAIALASLCMETGETQTCSWVGIKKNGERFIKELVFNRGKFKNKDIIITIGRNITEFKKTQAQIEKMTREIEIAEEIAGLGYWYFDIAANRTSFLSQKMLRLLGVTEHNNQSFSKDQLVEMVHADDLETLKDHFKNALENGSEFDIKFRLASQGTRERWLHTRGNILNDKKTGNPRIVSGVCEDITEQKLYEEELVNAKLKAEEVSRLKANFLSNMSHEIRTPINGILGISDIIAQEFASDEALMEYVGMLKESGNRLLETITSILNFSKLENSGLDVKLVEIDLCDAVNDTIQPLKILAKRKGLNVNCHQVDESPQIEFDRGVLSQILNNLIGNAIKFTEKGEIKVSVGKRSSIEYNWAFIEVKDSGIGISDEFFPQLFSPFRQESDGISRNYEGSGLGLSIVKKYIELFGGRIEVESTKGVGSTFTVLIPIKERK